MKPATKKFLSNIIKDKFAEITDAIKKTYPEVKKKGSEAYESLSEVISEATTSIDKWIQQRALETQENCELSDVPKMPKDEPVKVSHEKYVKLKDAYIDWLNAHEFLDQCMVPYSPPTSFNDYSLTGRIVELVRMAEDGEIGRELADMLNFIKEQYSKKK